MNKLILVPTGEPAGIGPDICLSLPPTSRQGLIFIGDINMLQQRAKDLGLDLSFCEVEDDASKVIDSAKANRPKAEKDNDDVFNIIHHPVATKVIPGQPDARNNPYLLKTLCHTVELQSHIQAHIQKELIRQQAQATSNNESNPAPQAQLKQQYLAPIITAPVSKQVINLSYPFIGLTEFLADCWNNPTAHDISLADEGMIALPIKESRIFCGTVLSPRQEEAKKEAMELRVAFITMHIPLATVATEIKPQMLEQKILDVARIISKHFSQQANSSNSSPHIALCGINPHAGEDGLLGTEEQQWIKPLVDKLNSQGLNISGPLSADSLFIPQNANNYDAIIAMSHDQGLAPFKSLTFGRGAQLSFFSSQDDGWSCLRLSPDHGTAFDLAASGKAHSGSMEYAIKLAHRL